MDDPSRVLETAALLRGYLPELVPADEAKTIDQIVSHCSTAPKQTARRSRQMESATSDVDTGSPSSNPPAARLCDHDETDEQGTQCIGGEMRPFWFGMTHRFTSYIYR